MPKRRERNSDEWYRAEIRELEKEVRRLNKRIKELEKRDYIFDDIIEEARFEKPRKKIVSCPECGKGELSVYDLVGRIFEECNICHYRKKLK